MRRFVVPVLFAACSSEPSPTGLQPEIDIDTSEGQLQVDVGVEGTQDADVAATFRGQTLHGAQASPTFNMYTMRFSLDRGVAADEPVTIDIDGIAMTITAPPPLDDVQLPASMSRSQTATISWTATSADPMEWVVMSSCAAGGGQIAPSSASLVLAANELASPAGATTCTATIDLHRSREAAVDPAFDDKMCEAGYLRFHQSFEGSFTSTP